MPNNTSCPRCGVENETISSCGVYATYGCGTTTNASGIYDSDVCLRNQLSAQAEELATQTARAVKYMRAVEQHDLEWSEMVGGLKAELATERARLAQVKAWVAGVIYYKHEDDDADIISILSDTPEVLAVVEGYAYPRDDGSLWCNVGDKVEGPDWVLDIHKHDNERNPGVPVTVTARTEGGG